VAAVGVVYAVKNRKVISEKTENVKEKAALRVHTKLGMPAYRYLKERNYIPF
jgi:hypothetical protein